MAKTIQTISECRKLIRKVNEQVRKANESKDEINNDTWYEIPFCYKPGKIKRTHERVDSYDLQMVLPKDHTISYITDLKSKDGSIYAAWQIGTYYNHYFHPVTDEKIYKDVVEKLQKQYPKDDIRITSRQYKYAPELPTEFLILLPKRIKRTQKVKESTKDESKKLI